MQNHQNHRPPAHQHSNYSTSTYGGGMNQNTSGSTMIMARRGHSPPPRFRPFMIILMVLFIGLAFIGLVMTIIAVWPGYTPVGGNPLKVAGPILLGIGGFGFIVGIINICYNSDREKKKDARKQALMYAHSMSRSTIASQHHYGPQPVTPTPSDKQPSKGILKNASSTSTYNGTAKGSDHGDSFSSTNQSYERDSMGSDSSARLDNIRVDMNPDPSMQKARKPKAYQNQAYNRETDIDGDITGRAQVDTRRPEEPKRVMQTYANKGFDMYDSGSTDGANLSGSGSLTGQASLTGAGMLSPYGAGSPLGGTPGGASQSKWGGNTPQRAPPSTGRSNQAYVGGGVATVSTTYQQMTTPQRPSSARQQLHYGGTPRGHYNASPVQQTLNSSTDV